MIRPRVPIAAVIAAAVSLVVLAGPASAASRPKLVGVVGKNDAYKIKLTFKGRIVKTLKAGTYTVVIHDDSKIHNYELDGPHGKSWTFTKVPFVGTKTFTLRLRRGKYKAYCKPHEPAMFQRFRVK